MIVLCGGVYWLAGLSRHHHLVAGGAPTDVDAGGLATAIYFSFVTATSVGYGDVLPVGMLRGLAVAEAVVGLLIFGAVIAKFVSRRQDEIMREIQRVTFEERLDRVQTNLHLVLSELQTVLAMCDSGTVRLERLRPRLGRGAPVFAGRRRALYARVCRSPPRAARHSRAALSTSADAGGIGAGSNPHEPGGVAARAERTARLSACRLQPVAHFCGNAQNPGASCRRDLWRVRAAGLRASAHSV